MNTNKASAIALAKGVAQGAPKRSVQVGVAPPFVYLDAVGQALAGWGFPWPLAFLRLALR